MLEVIQDPFLKKMNTIKHGFFTRSGGVSTGIYASLNCAYPSNDCPDNVCENRRRAMAQLGYSLESLITVRNRHSNIAVIADKPWLESQKPEADAIVTNLPNIVLGSDSADCPIILLADENTGVIGLAHAGWRGAKDGIIEATIEKMILLGSQMNRITAAISPCIAQCSYEVSFEFKNKFIQDTQDNEIYFIPSQKKEHFLFNLLSYVKDRLLILGLKSVSDQVAFDTYVDERFFSCRRAAHKGEPWFGGHLSCIAMTEYL